MDDVDLYIDGELIGRISKGKPLVVPSLPSGLHEFRGVREGYEPDRKEVMIAPGQEVTVSAPHPLRPADQEAGAGSQRRRREAAVHAPFVVEPDESGAGRAQAERGRPQEGGGAVREGACDGSGLRLAAYHLGQVNQLLLKHDEAVAHFRRAIAIDPTAHRCAHRMRGRADRAGRSGRSDPRADRSAAARSGRRRGVLDAGARLLGQGGVGPRRGDRRKGDQDQAVERAGASLEGRRAAADGGREHRPDGAGQPVRRCAHRLPRAFST